MKFLLYGHGGAYNHGAEAIAKSTIKYLKNNFRENKIVLSTHFKEQDLEFSIPADKIIERSAGETYAEIYAPTINEITPETVCIHIGGDNYCYPKWERWAEIHAAAKMRGAKSVLWSTSLEPSALTAELCEVLKTHDLITARDGITYNALVSKGFANVLKVSDIAFSLEPERAELPFSDSYCTLNLSPLVVRKNPVLLDAYRELVKFILEKTEMNIALLPHVIQPVDNDEEALGQLLIENEPRIKLVSGKNSAGALKYIISKSRFCITARTHAAIAAYSSLVPVLAIGYSSKAFGIAEDLSLRDFTVNAAEIKTAADLLPAAEKLFCDEEKIRGVLGEKIPGYKKETVKKEITELLKK